MNIFCLDFDGVICDTAAEMAHTAWKACQQIWPPPREETALSQTVVERFRRLRPLIKTGYQAIPLMRLIQIRDEPLDGKQFSERQTALYTHHRLSSTQLQELFARTRDAWISRDFDEWLGHSRFYPGVPELLARMVERNCVFILTTKQARFVTALLKEKARLNFPEDKIYDLDRTRSKEHALRDLKQIRNLGNEQFHFVEDRLETLLDLLGSSDLQDVKLYLAGWGYNTEAQRQRAENLRRITVWGLEPFRVQCQRMLES